MPLNRNTLMRMRTIDACLQRRQRRWTIEDLRQACEDALYDYEGISTISVRTTQRDIELMRSDKLGYNAPIVVRDRKYYEYSDPDFSITQMPLSSEDIAELSSAMDIIRHYQGFQSMQGQEDVLARLQDHVSQQKSHEQVVYIETNTRLKGLDFLGPLYDLIVQKVPIVVHYRSFKSRRDCYFHLSPYLLKEFNNRWFLISYSHKMKNVQTIALDRIVDVNKDEDGVYQPNAFFNPAEYLESMVGVTRDLHSKARYVRLKIDSETVPYIETKPLHVSQKIEHKLEDGSVIASINVVQNLELERLLLGYGYHIEVLSPRILRHNIAKHVSIMATRYLSDKDEKE